MVLSFLTSRKPSFLGVCWIRHTESFLCGERTKWFFSHGEVILFARHVRKEYFSHVTCEKNDFVWSPTPLARDQLHENSEFVFVNTSSKIGNTKWILNLESVNPTLKFHLLGNSLKILFSGLAKKFLKPSKETFQTPIRILRQTSELKSMKQKAQSRLTMSMITKKL